MYGVPVGASRGLRWGCLGLATVFLLTTLSDAADAKQRRKRQPTKRAVQAETYSPRYAAIVIDAKTGTTLHQASPDALRHPASLTKIMTLYLLFEQMEAGRMSLATEMEVSAQASMQAPTKLGLQPGQKLTVEDAIKGLVTKSANDASVVVAEALAGNEAEFARQMTRKARSLGMNQTVYRNASGLPNQEQITTARDQAMLGIAIQERFPRYYRYFATASFTYKGRAMRNHNHLLGRVEGVDGIKTGFTNASGFNLVTSVKRGERQIVAVVLGGRSSGQRDARMRSLIETHIAEASTRRTRVAQNAAATEAPAASPPGTFPAPPPIIAAIAAAFAAPSASAAPLSSPAPQTAEAAAPVVTPSVGSDEPIKPVKVKTVTVKVAAVGSQAKAVAKPAAAPAAAKPAAANPVAVAAAPAASEPKAAPKPETRVEPRANEAASAPAANTRSNLLSNAVAAAGSAIVPKAAASEAPAPVRPTSRGGWAVQIGAFEDEGEARQRLSAAQAKAAHLLSKADRYTERTVKGDKTFYRARFVGFDRDRAEAVCRQLKRSEMDCLALKF